QLEKCRKPDYRHLGGGSRRCDEMSFLFHTSGSVGDLGGQPPRSTRPIGPLGAIAVERQDWSTALGHLQRSLRGSAPTDSIVRKLFALIARCHQMLGDLAAALNACSEGLRIDPDDAELHFRKAGPAPLGGPAGRGRGLL